MIVNMFSALTSSHIYKWTVSERPGDVQSASKLIDKWWNMNIPEFIRTMSILAAKINFKILVILWKKEGYIIKP